ncbi:ABC transporter permease [Atopobiaceae bacterium 24-176]
MLKNWWLALLTLVRDRSFIVWCVGLPLGLATIFIFMFQPIEKLAVLEQMPVAAVRPDDGPEAETFRAFMDALGAADDGAAAFEVSWYDTKDEARRAVEGSLSEERPLIAAVSLDGSDISVELAPSTDSMVELEQSVAVSVFDGWSSSAAAAQAVAQRNPADLARPAVARALSDMDGHVDKVSLTESAPRETVSFYFALLGFTALMCSQCGLMAARALVPGEGPCSARVTVSGQPRAGQLACWLSASWAASFAGLGLCLAYLCVAAPIDFGSRFPFVVLALAVASLMATGLGGLVAVTGPRAAGAKDGILTTITCVGALFAGLYGEPVMEMANSLARTAPVTAWINPARQVMESLSSLVYYDSLAPYWGHLGLVAAFGVACFAIAVFFLRRLRRESL